MRYHGEEDKAELSPREVQRERIAKRAALEFHDGMYGILITIYIARRGGLVCVRRGGVLEDSTICRPSEDSLTDFF